MYVYIHYLLWLTVIHITCIAWQSLNPSLEVPMAKRNERQYGLVRDKPDPEDRKFKPSHSDAIKDVPVFNLTKYISHDFDQGKLESCTANVLCSAYGLEIRKQHEKDPRFHYFEPSRLFVYYNSRVYEGTAKKNVPVSYRDALKSIHKKGVCKESLWPYDASKFNVKPPNEAYEDAKGNTISKYERLEQNLHHCKACLVSGSPIALGMEVYENFHDLEAKGTDGVLKMPSKEELIDGPWGLHAVLMVGYNDHNKQFKILNSYGDDFGVNGYFFMPYEFAMNHDRCFDFWKIVHSTESDVQERQENA